MTEVFFSETIQQILHKIDYSKLGKNVGIKVHFGEKGCNTYISPDLVRQVYEKIISLGKNASLIECNVLYKGSRSDSTTHLKTAKEHGFDMPTDILDGENGMDYIEVDGCKIGKGITKYDSLIVVTHFKGHMMAGFGGSIKNVAMGLASRAGKLWQHSDIKPYISSNCVGCGVCIKNCDVDAITMIDGKAKIDETKCIGCAMCIAVCNYGAASAPWGGGTPKDLQKKVSRYAMAIKKLFPNAIYINTLQNITVDCDCMGIEQQPIMKNIGFLASTDIVAIDKASLDLANKLSDGKFNRINKIDKESQIIYAEEIGLGESKYNLVENSIR